MKKTLLTFLLMTVIYALKAHDIIGPSSFCSDEAQTFAVANDSPCDRFQWSVSGNGTYQIIGSSTARSVSVRFVEYGTYTVRLMANNPGICGAAAHQTTASFQVVAGFNIGKITSVAGPSSLTFGDTQRITLTAEAITPAVPGGKVTYFWNLPEGWVGPYGRGGLFSTKTNSVQVTPYPYQTAQIEVYALLSCGNGVPSKRTNTFTKTISVSTDDLYIVGPSAGCGGTYSVANLPPRVRVSWSRSTNLNYVRHPSPYTYQVRGKTIGAGFVKARISSPSGIVLTNLTKNVQVTNVPLQGSVSVQQVGVGTCPADGIRRFRAS